MNNDELARLIRRTASQIESDARGVDTPKEAMEKVSEALRSLARKINNS